IRLTFAGISDRMRRMILGENAAKLYDFDLEKLRPLADRHGPTPAQVDSPLPFGEIPEDSACYVFHLARRELAEQQESNGGPG
ncbi:MAG: hypothetical protein AAEJ52_08780, partial [Myxococcota bacterium]